MIDRSKIIILVLGSNEYPWVNNWKECNNTWIPLLKQLGYHVKTVLADPTIDNYFSDEGDIIKFRVEDSKKSIVDKRLKLPISWILNHTDYEYYIAMDSDVFVHPHRFDKMMVENLLIYNPAYMGCIMPYDNYNPNFLATEFRKLVSSPLQQFASGICYLLRRDILSEIYPRIRIDREIELEMDDWVLGRVIEELNIPLLHDSRIFVESKYRTFICNPYNTPTPYIGDKNSHLAVQHYLQGHMAEILNELIC